MSSFKQYLYRYRRLGVVLAIAFVLPFIWTGCRSTPKEYGWLTPKTKTSKETQNAIKNGTTILGQSPTPTATPTPYHQPNSNYPVVPAPASAPYDPWMANNATAPQNLTGPSHLVGTPAPNIGAPAHTEIPANVHANRLPLPAARPDFDDPWDMGDPDAAVRRAVSIDEAAKKEEEQQEKARLMELAASKRDDGTPEYLQPLDKWSGPFDTRQQKQNIEQDIIKQVGLVEVEPRSFDNSPVYDWEKENQKAFDWSVLDPVNLYTKIRDGLGMGPDEKKAQAALESGRAILVTTPDMKNKSKCLAAAKHFMTAAKRWPDSVLAEDALHLAGECYFFGEDYPRAMKSYQQLLIKYQHSKHLDNAVRRLFVIARYWEKEDRRGVSFTNYTDKSRPTFDTFGYSKKAYETIFINDPNGPISDDAVMALASAYLAKGRYQGDYNFDQAAYYYSYLRENFPLSKHLAKAHENELHARANAYMGAEHSSHTLDEAGKLADVTLRQFGSELDGKDKEEITTLKESLVERQAEREWTMGQFYDKKHYYGSAKLYYRKLMEKYPQTIYAEKARARFEQIQNMPEEPDQFGFLKKLVQPRGTVPTVTKN